MSVELGPDDKEKLKRAIIAGSILASVYFFDQMTADEWYAKDEKGNFKLKRRTTIGEIFK